MLPIKQQIAILILVLALIVFIIELVRRRSLNVQYSWHWLLLALVLLAVALNYRILIVIRDLLGMGLTSSALFLLGILFLLVLTIYYSVRISTLNRQVKDLAQRVAILELRMKQTSRGRSSGKRPGTTRSRNRTTA